MSENYVVVTSAGPVEEVLRRLPRSQHTGEISNRITQRTIALWVAWKQKRNVSPEIPREDLRKLCQEFRVYDTSVFSYYMADDRFPRAKGLRWFTQVGPEGWDLTEDGVKAMRRAFEG